ncbi:MAG: hypothetical protein AB1814_00270 [Thermodesulfobacteriota bacterium]
MNLKERKLRQAGVWVLAALVAMTWLAGWAAPAPAAQETVVNVTVVMSGPRPTVLPAGDSKDHFIGAGQRIGKAVFSDGREAKYSNVFTFDMQRGKSFNSQGYTKMVFADGSWLFFQWKSAVVGRDKNGTLGKGQGVILKGAGAYQGIKGTATFSNRQLPPSKEHPQGATEAKAVLRYTLP